MDMFLKTLTQMLMMATFIVIGFTLRKKKIVPEDTGITLSRLETYLFVPALNFFNQAKYCTIDNLRENSGLIMSGAILAIAAIILAIPLSHLFVRRIKNSDDRYRRNIYRYAMTYANFGYMGNFIILGLWGDAVFFKYTMMNLLLSITCNTYGLYLLIPKDKSAGILENLKKGLLSPPMIGLFAGMLCGLLNVQSYIPAFLSNALDNASKCMGPVAMVLAGVVIGGYEIGGLLKIKKVYFATLFRIVIIPVVFALALKLLGVNNELLTLAIIALGSPLGLNTIIYPAAYGGETKTGASMTMISTVLSVITIPVLYYLLVVLW